MYFINNKDVGKHDSIIFGIRELSFGEMDEYCSEKSLPMTNQPFNFSSKYQLRTYLSGCFYLDSNNHWKSDGLLVRNEIFFLFM